MTGDAMGNVPACCGSDGAGNVLDAAGSTTVDSTALDTTAETNIRNTNDLAAAGDAGGHLATLGGAAAGFTSKYMAHIPAGGLRHIGGVVSSESDRQSSEETSPVTRTAQGFGLSVMESAPSRDDAVVVGGGFCTTIPVGSRVVRVNGVAVRSVDDIRTVLEGVPVGGSAEIGYHPSP